MNLHHFVVLTSNIPLPLLPPSLSLSHQWTDILKLLENSPVKTDRAIKTAWGSSTKFQNISLIRSRPSEEFQKTFLLYLVV